MIAVILPPGPSSTMHGLDAEQSLALLPLGDRPILQHIVESLASQGITSIEVITGHAPERVEALLGNGDRWGCSFRHHLATQQDRPYRSLKVIDRTRAEPWVLIHADQYACVSFSHEAIDKPTLYCHNPPDATAEAPEFRASVCACDPMKRWGGTAVFPAGDFGDLISDMSFNQLQVYLQHSLARGESTTFSTHDWIDATTPDALLDTQARLLAKKLDGLMISGIERQPGIWISRNVEVHPSVTLIAPLYIGPNCRINRGVRLGPDVVISGGSIIDSNTVIDQSIAMAGSYIGEGLELSRSIVNHDLLVNVRLGTSVSISESFLLGGLEPKGRQGALARGLQCCIAGLLILLLWPVLLLALVYFAVVRRLYFTSGAMAKTPLGSTAQAAPTFLLSAVGADAWAVERPAGWSAFTRQFLPGLFAVLAGKLSLVGLPPRTADQLEQLPPEWRALYARGRVGLITESAVAVSDVSDQTQLYLADAYYSAERSSLHDLRLAGKYMLRLVVPARSS